MNILILEGEIIVNQSDCLTIFWDRYDVKSSNHFSIPKILDDNCEYYKNLYLKIISDISDFKINNKSIIDSFLRKDNFNFWWLTSIQQKFNIDDSSGINNSIKLLVLSDFLSNYSVDSVSVFTRNQNLRNSLREFCVLNNIKFIGDYKFINNDKTLFNIWKSFIFSFKYSFFYLLNNRLFDKKNFQGDVSFFDIFVHLKENSFYENKFSSSYVNGMVDILRNSKYIVNWTHLFYSHKLIPKFSDAKKLTSGFNKYDSFKFKHLFIEDYLSLYIIFKAIFIYLITFPKYYFIYVKSRQFLKYNKINFFPLLKDEFNESLFGISRIVNEIRILSFDLLFKNSKKQIFGFYIQENQPWELILISKWKKYNHGQIFGVPHSTVRFWDLRYFDSIDNLNRKLEFLPDSILVNSKYAYNLLDIKLFNQYKIEIVEALRYQHLNNLKTKIIPFNIIVFGDFQQRTTEKILLIVDEASKKLGSCFNFYFKQHPAFYFDLSLFNFTEDLRTTEEILFSYDIMISSDSSSTAAEAYSLGRTVIQYLDGSKLNFSPIKGLNGSQVFIDSNNLCDILNNYIFKRDFEKDNLNAYFYLDINFAHWRRILQID